MTNAATPRPWQAVDGILLPDDEGHERSFIRPEISQGYQIAHTVGPDGPANAALIVRAVNSLEPNERLLEEMAEALKRIHSAHDRYIESNPNAVENPDWLDDEINASRAALSSYERSKEK
jgi:hypothetical protein